VAGTKILTDKGQKNIEDIKLGDLVMTREGYRAVEYWSMTGKKEVIKNIGLVGTFNHPVIVRKFGMDWIKNLTSVNLSDTLYIWNEKLSCIEEKNIIDTLIPEGVNLRYIFGDTTNGKVLPLHCIVKYGLIILGIYLKNIMSITKTEILSTIKLKILSLYQHLIMLENIPKKDGLIRDTGKNNSKILMTSGISQKNGMDQKRVWRGIKNIAKIFGKIGNLLKYIVFNVARNLCQKMGRVNIVRPITEINSEKKTPKDLKEVYNIQVEGTHEYFANGILVHNCDCLSNVIEIMVPVAKTVDRAYAKFAKTRVPGMSVKY
jgi:hypothetical protein